MNGSTDLEGGHGMINALDLEGSRLPDCQDFSQTMGCCDWRLGGRTCSGWFSTAYGYGKGRTDVSERGPVYGLGRGPCHEKCVEFRVC